MIRRAIEQGGRDEIEEISRAIESTGALAYTASQAEKAASRAVDALAPVPDSELKQALVALARFATERRF